MKQVQIKTMALHYFKGVKNASYDFGPKITIISGPNGCGKSTIMDAFNWCLWGKNAAGRADFLVKTVDENGEEIPHVEHSVELTLIVNGEPQTFRRTLVPEYDRDDRLKGNHTDYTWNNVPLKKTEYDSKVTDIITEDIFKLISSTTAFLNLDWKIQRRTLMDMAGDVDYVTIATKLDGDDPEGQYIQLINKFRGIKNFDEYKRELDAHLKSVGEKMLLIPARIDEVAMNTPAMPNIPELEQQQAELQEQLRAIEQQEADDTAIINASNKQRTDILKAITDLEWKAQQMVNEVEARERTAIHEANQTFLRAQSEYNMLSGEVIAENQQMRNRVNVIENQRKRNQAQREQLQQQLQDLRTEWVTENSRTFQTSEYLICPLTKQACNDGAACAYYDQNQQRAFDAFTQQKNASLDSTLQRGKQISAQIDQLMQTIDSQLQEINAIEQDGRTKFSAKETRLKELEDIMQTNPKRPIIAKVDVNQIPGYAEMQKQIADMRSILANLQQDSAPRTDNRAAKQQIIAQLQGIAAEMAKQQQIHAANQRIAQLQTELADLGQQRAEIEMAKRLMLDMEIARMNAVSERVNAMFCMVKFQMFQRQVNGEEVPACVCLCDGVRWQDANTATRINAGIDIAAALANHYKSFAPVFIDGAESVGSIYCPDLPIQQIRLKFDATGNSIKTTHVK